ncbi:nicotinate-nucleotide pyrophosphorylase (carboxylating) [Gracilibacillus halotolerans]|uniref:Probable nicotinate-nucleotide pyrophosphorylase [carboxylating] n=1 Tax=Gracilibacillus halotolerans TaxID=74386 RepID=A0A841RIY7_9BACI|nr:nicotinate-nucleotide pyrophosphorylase (carboxylating) [Gracilibacillus halotolerans]
MNSLQLKEKLKAFFKEDIGNGDISSEFIFNKGTKGKISFLAKEDGIFCGKDIIKTGYQLLESEIQVKEFVEDGDKIRKGDHIAEVSGSVPALLLGERVILNLLQRLSGIATLTNQAVTVLDDDHTRICDTRKTTPGLRMLEKYAVRCGGGYNHRFGLYDAVMLKDNHLTFAGSLQQAVHRVRKQVGHTVKIEVEVETKDQVREAVDSGADIIMFDNCSPELVKEFQQLVPAHILTEASGGIQLDNLATYRNTGVDYISLGFLTHSVPSLDISVEAI